MTRTVLQGRAGSPGVGVGRVLLVSDGPAGPEATGSPAASAGGAAAGSPAAERDRLQAALVFAAADLEALAMQTAARAGDEIGAIFEAQALFARDPGVVDPALVAIDGGASADVAILRATDEQAAVLAAVDDAYFRERAADVRDVGRRVAAILRDERRPDLWHADGVPAIVVAADLDPSAVATLRPELVAGIALVGGAPTGHAAIVARALGIPLVLGLGAAIAAIPADATVVIDGASGEVVIDPTDVEIADRRRSATGPVVTPVPATGPVHGVTVVANVASALEAEAAARAGADGIGLVRTELLFLGRAAPPSVAEQRATYAAIRAAMGERAVVFRTLDIGGDKPTAWQPGVVEANPALGVRGLRLGLRHPALLDDQFAALLSASAGGALDVMLPMVSTREELDLARARLAAVAGRLAEAGVATVDPAAVRLGVMIEVPSAALMADALADAADFFSIGTNDLVQYTLAADRTNPELADLASALQPAVLRLIDIVLRAAAERDRHVAVCGEAAADPRVIPLLVGLGVQELSVSPGSIAAVRTTLTDLDPATCRALAVRATAATTLAEVQAIVGESNTPGRGDPGASKGRSGEG